MNNDDRIETVRLEMIRPGPAHGQLLSPLTPYLALCGDDSPVTLNIDFEHWRLLNRLNRLRYVTQDDSRGMVAHPDSSRESELDELGRDVGDIFAAIPTLKKELGHAAGKGSGLVHLRMLISGSELSLLPFELLISPAGYPGFGRPLLLQPETPIVMTREIRRGQHDKHIDWNREPHILFASAAPGDMHVPVREHVQALRRVIEPWVTWADDSKTRLKDVEKHLTVLPNASLHEIRMRCASNNYTHVHILAHGGSYKESGQTRFGVVLCDKNEPSRPHVVDGKTLAETLHVRFRDKRGSSSPLVASLATCDSGNPGAVIAPGGSIAHELHQHGVPWVFASQFPLTKRGSIVMTEELYRGLLWGEDPRALLADLRHSLHVERGRDHDWGSLVAYASIPDDLADDVAMFRGRQYQRAIDNDRARADHFQTAMNSATNELEKEKFERTFRESLQAARGRIEQWKDRLLPTDTKSTKILPLRVVERRRRAHVECFGVQGATEKKLAEVYFEAGMLDEEQNALRASMSAYRHAVNAEPLNHWPATQLLALRAILGHDPDPGHWVRLREITKGQVEVAHGVEKAWAHGTLAELELLRTYHAPMYYEGSVMDEVVQHCDAIVKTVGIDDFAVMSTRRQFNRYINWWKNDAWRPIAKAAVAALGG